MERQLLSQLEVAAWLQVSCRTLEAWRRRADAGPPFVRVGRCVRYNAEAVEAWIAARGWMSTMQRATCTAAADVETASGRATTRRVGDAGGRR